MPPGARWTIDKATTNNRITTISIYLRSGNSFAWESSSAYVTALSMRDFTRRSRTRFSTIWPPCIGTSCFMRLG
jgi:hypothetical protein